MSRFINAYDGESERVHNIEHDAFERGYKAGKNNVLKDIKAEITEYMNDCAVTSIYTRLGFQTAINVIDNHISGKEAEKKMSEATKCDRCGTYIDKSVSDMPRIAYCPDIRHERYSISLCYECYEKFLNEYGGRTDDLPIQS